LPVVKKTIDTLTSIAVKQRLFLSRHADRVKQELVKERSGASLSVGQWKLTGFSLSAEDAVDLVRASPDSLSNLTYTGHTDSTNLWTKLTSWLKLGDAKAAGMSVEDDLSFALAVNEVVECAGHTLAGVGYALSQQTPSVGGSLERSLAFELQASKHRGHSHAMYLVLDITHAAQRSTSGTVAKTLKVDTSLYVHRPMLLGGVSGVAVNTSGVEIDDLPTADVDRRELRSVLSRKGTFVASAVSDFVLENTEVTSERIATIAMSAVTRLVTAANTALSGFLDSETRQQEVVRTEKRAVARESAIAQEVALQRKREEAAEAAYEQQQQRAAYEAERERERFDELQVADPFAYGGRLAPEFAYGAARR
jgi:hypothetical protein